MGPQSLMLVILLWEFNEYIFLWGEGESWPSSSPPPLFHLLDQHIIMMMIYQLFIRTVQDISLFAKICYFQRLINSTIDKYNLKNAKDTHLPAAVKEVKNYICTSTSVGGVDDKKIAERIKKTLQWKRYYSRKR